MNQIYDFNEINYYKINCSEEISTEEISKKEKSKFLIENRNKFYEDLIYLNESTQITKVNYRPYFTDYSTLNLDENNECENSNIVMELPNDD